MKALIVASSLFLASLSTYAIGRPHNIFATRKAMVSQVSNQPSKDIKPQAVLKTVTEKVEQGMQGARNTLSFVEKVSSFFMKFID